MPITFLDEPEVEAPLSGIKFLDGPEIDPTPDQVRQRMADPAYVPTYGDIAIVDKDDRSKSFSKKASEVVSAAGSAVPQVIGHLGKNIGEGAWQAWDNYANQGRAATESLAAAGLTAGEGLLRGTLDLGQLVRRAGIRGLDYLAPTTQDPVAAKYSRVLENRQWDAMRQQMAEGQQGGWIDPSKSLQNNGMIAPAGAEAISTVADASVLVPGGLLAKAGTAVARRAALKVGEGALTHAAEAASSIAGRVADVATKPAQIVKDTVDKVLPGTGAGTIAAATPAAIGATVAVPARVVEKGAEAVQHLGRTVGDSSAGRLTQLSMSESAPSWLRGAARNLARTGVDKAASYAGDVAKSSATGAAVGTALAAPSTESTEEFGAAIGSGATMGGLTHIAMTPVIHGRQYRMAQDADILRWHESKPVEEQAAIHAMGLDREQALQLMTAEVVANGFIDPNANVRFVYQDPTTFEATYGAQRGVALVQGDKPTIIFNAGKMKTGTAYHELFHTLSRSPDIIDYGALTTKLLGVQDEAGNVIKPGLLSTTDLAKIGDQYFSRLDPVGQKSVAEEKAAFDASPGSPQAAPWVKRMINEIGAELFSNLARDTKGSLLDAVDKPTLMLVDSMTRGDRSQWVQKWGAKLQEVLGAAPKVESDIFPGLKSSPELQAMMRDFVRTKRDLTKTPEFGDEHADPTVVVNPRDALRTGGDEIVKKFPDNDNFAKDVAGQPMYSGGRPVLLTEGEIRKVQTKRAEEMAKALTTVPDSGEAGVMRPTTAPAATGPKAPSPGFTGRWFSDAQIAALSTLSDSVLTPSMKAKLKSLNDLLRKADGSPILLFYNAALKNRRYSSAIRETARVLTPISVSITKAGNFIVTGLDITAFNSKLNRWMNDKPNFFKDFGSADIFVQKTQQYLDNHQKGQPGATGLDPDAAKALAMSHAINDFINITDVANAARNPSRVSTKNDKDSLIRSFRFDRMNRIEPASGDKFPVNYEFQKQVFSPQGEKEANQQIRGLREGRSNSEEAIWTNHDSLNVTELKKGDDLYGAIIPRTDGTFVARLGRGALKEFPSAEEARKWVEHTYGIDQTKTGAAPPPDRLRDEVKKLDKESGQYSQLERTVDQKVQGKEIPAAQLAAMLRNPQNGVKAEELRWSGVEEFLRGKGKVSKQEVLDFVRANRLQIEEKRLGEDRKTPEDISWQSYGDGSTRAYLGTPDGRLGPSVAEIIPTTDPQFPEIKTFEATLFESDDIPRQFDTFEQAKAWVLNHKDVAAQMTEFVPTKYDQYKSPGGENYREILFRFPDTTQVKDGPKDHWQDARVFAHTRVQDFDGGKTLLIDEVQSDWHQKGRKSGYANLDSPERARLQGELDSLKKRFDEEHDQNAFLAYDLSTELKRLLKSMGYESMTDMLQLKRTDRAKYDSEFARYKALQAEDPKVRTLEDAIKESKLKQDQWINQMDEIRRAKESFEKGPNEAPFSKTWHEFVMKRILRDAVEKGYDAVEWPDGKTIAKRFDLAQHVNELHYVKDSGQSGDGWTLYLEGDEGNAMFILDKDLDGHVGETVAARMRNNEGHPRQLNDPVRVLSGEFELGNEAKGMKEFYDGILPSFVSKYVKKWGGEVKDSVRAVEAELTSGRKLDLQEIERDIKRVEAEMEEASRRPMSAALRMNRLQTEHRALVEKRQKLLQADGFPVHRIEITPKMREDIATKGQPLFSPDAPETTPSKMTPIGVKKDVDILPPAGKMGAVIKTMFSPAEVQFQRVKPLPHAVGDEEIPVVHFSSQPGLKKLDPAYMGKGMANSRDRRGGAKSFFFVAESPLGADEQFFGQGGKVAYGAVLSGTRLYDLRVGKPDPLGFNNALNPALAEETLASKGYAGVLVEGGKQDPRKTVILFKRAAVKELPNVKGPLKRAPRVEFSPDVKGTPSEEIRTQAAEYNKAAKLDTTPHQTAVPVREDLAKRIADAFDAAQDRPNDPRVKRAYKSLADETQAQWDFIVSKGVKMEPWKKEGQPYKNSAEMIADVRDNKHLWFFPTDAGFGSGGAAKSHPMLAPSKVPGLVVNDLFRAVHDYFGHAKEGFEFGPKGEYNAYLAHNQMFSNAARPALASETLAQNSWVNYGKHLRRPNGSIPVKGQEGYVPVTERPYAAQKAALMPEELVAEATKKSVDKVAPLMSPDDMKLGIENDYGNVDISRGVPEGFTHIPGKRLLVTAKANGIAAAPALLGFSRGYGGYKPRINGIVIRTDDAAKWETARAKKRGTTPALTAKRRVARQDKATSQFIDEIQTRFPSMPEADVFETAVRATEIGSGRVGRSSTAEDPVKLAVIAHIRHQHTDYDSALSSARERSYDGIDITEERTKIRRRIQPTIDATLAKWSEKLGEEGDRAYDEFIEKSAPNSLDAITEAEHDQHSVRNLRP